MVKVLLDNDTFKDESRWVYIPECSCNNAFFTRMKFNHLPFSIVRLIALVIINDYYACLDELLSEVFSVTATVISGATETNEYLEATTHEMNCLAFMRRTSYA